MDSRLYDRTAVLRAFGATRQDLEDLLRYNASFFDTSSLTLRKFPLEDGRFVRVWEGYANDVRQAGTIRVLEKYLVQMRFPVRAGMSRSVEYLAAVQHGIAPEVDASDGLGLAAPQLCELVLHPTLAGRIPVLVTAMREDFELIVQALSSRNEPVPIPPSMGAVMISGYRNWHRIHSICEQHGCRMDEVTPEARELLQDKANYQDSFIILSRGFYSGIAPADMGLDEEEWRRTSVLIRREHECTHYFTRRVLSSMRTNLLDEILADYCGIVAGHGRFRADWMLRFFGLEDFPRYRQGGRLENYVIDAPLSTNALAVLHRLVKSAAENLEAFDQAMRDAARTAAGPMSALLVLSAFALEELAAEGAAHRLISEFAARFHVPDSGEPTQPVLSAIPVPLTTSGASAIDRSKR